MISKIINNKTIDFVLIGKTAVICSLSFYIGYVGYAMPDYKDVQIENKYYSNLDKKYYVSIVTPPDSNEPQKFELDLGSNEITNRKFIEMKKGDSYFATMRGYNLPFLKIYPRINYILLNTSQSNN